MFKTTYILGEVDHHFLEAFLLVVVQDHIFFLVTVLLVSLHFDVISLCAILTVGVASVH